MGKRVLDEKYLRLGLLYNPFPVERGAETYFRKLDELRIAKIRREVYAELENMAKKIISECACFIVYGDWGSGKTHTLLTFAKLMNEFHRDTHGDRIITIHVAPTPLAEDRSFYKEIALSMLETLRNHPSASSNPKIKSIIFSLSSCNSLKCLEDVVKNLIDENFIVYIALDQLEQDLMELIQIPSAQGKIIEIAQRIETFARSLARNIGRRLALGISIYAPAYQALMLYMAKGFFNEIYLPPLQSIDEIKTLIKEYLNDARVSLEELVAMGIPTQHTERLKQLRQRMELHPFSEEAIEAILKVCTREGCSPRRVLYYAGKSLDIAIERGLEYVVPDAVYASVDIRYLNYVNALKKYFPLTWTQFLSVVRKVIELAAELGSILLYPSKLSADEARQYYSLKKGYRIDTNMFIIDGTKLVYVNRRTSRKVRPDDIKKALDAALELRNAGLRIDKVIFISLTDMSIEARSWISAILTKGINFEFVRIKDSVEELGKLLFLADNVHNPIVFKNLGTSLENELNDVIRNILKIKV